jgi:hypothetical protein
VGAIFFFKCDLSFDSAPVSTLAPKLLNYRLYSKRKKENIKRETKESKGGYSLSQLCYKYVSEKYFCSQ